MPMHQEVSMNQPSIQDLRDRLQRANARCDLARTDGEYEACRQLAIYARAELEAAQANAWRTGR